MAIQPISLPGMALILAVGLLTGLVAFQVPMRLWQKYSFPLFFLGVVLLALVLIPA